MSIIKSNKKNKLFPWDNENLKNFLSSDSFFNDDFFFDNAEVPAMNIKENKNNFDIELLVPGFEKEDFEITVDDNILNVKAEKKAEQETKEDGYLHKEFSFNSFKRSLKLPNAINQQKEAKASYNNGILKLTIDKQPLVKVTPTKVIKID